MAEPALDNAAVEQRLALIDDVLGRLETIPGATSALGMQAVQALTEVYGTALRRVIDIAADTPAVLDGFDRDELLRHLLVLHDLHPHPLEERVHAALDRIRPYLNSHGGDVSVVAIEDGTVRVAFTGHCDGCTSSMETMQNVIRDAILAAAPEIDRVDAEPAAAPAHPAPTSAVIPVDALLRRPMAHT